MFANSKAFSGFAVDDVRQGAGVLRRHARPRTSEEHGLLTLHLAGDRPTLVYPKPDHTPATFTILNFPVDDIDEGGRRADRARRRVRALRGLRAGREAASPAGEGPDIAWFKDPAGNVLSVLKQ